MEGGYGPPACAAAAHSAPSAPGGALAQVRSRVAAEEPPVFPDKQALQAGLVPLGELASQGAAVHRLLLDALGRVLPTRQPDDDAAPPTVRGVQRSRT